MSKELKHLNALDSTIYCIIRNALGKVWNGSAFEAWGTDGHSVANYAIAMTGDDGGLFMGDFPEEIPTGTYTLQYFKQAGANPVVGDECTDAEKVTWNGYARMS